MDQRVATVEVWTVISASASLLRVSGQWEPSRQASRWVLGTRPRMTRRARAAGVTLYFFAGVAGLVAAGGVATSA